MCQVHGRCDHCAAAGRAQGGQPDGSEPKPQGDVRVHLRGVADALGTLPVEPFLAKIRASEKADSQAAFSNAGSTALLPRDLGVGVVVQTVDVPREDAKDLVLGSIQHPCNNRSY